MSLPSWSLPSKTRHLDISEIETTTPIVLDNGCGSSHDLVDDARRNNEALLVREEHVLSAFAIRWSARLTHRVERSRDVGHLPTCAELPTTLGLVDR